MLTTLHNWPSHPVLMVMMDYMIERKQVSQALKRNGYPRWVARPERWSANQNTNQERKGSWSNCHHPIIMSGAHLKPSKESWPP